MSNMITLQKIAAPPPPYEFKGGDVGVIKYIPNRQDYKFPEDWEKEILKAFNDSIAPGFAGHANLNTDLHDLEKKS